MLDFLDKLQVIGIVEWELLEDCKIIDLGISQNLVVDSGKIYIADQLNNSPVINKMSHYAIGTGYTPVDSGDSSLEIELARVSLSTVISNNYQIEYSSSFLPGVGTNNSIRESGIFNAASDGTMFARVVFAPITKSDSQTLNIKHIIKFIEVSI